MSLQDIRVQLGRWIKLCRDCISGSDTAPPKDILLNLRGSGKELWADEHADDYVHGLRKHWD